MIAKIQPKFPLGQIVATPASLTAMERANEQPATFLNRHVSGDWGEVCEEDKQANEQALIEGTRLFSAYRLNDGTKIWIITEAADDSGNRAATTILLPDEY